MTYVLSMEHLSASEAAELIGYQDRNLNCLCELYGAEIIFRDNQFTIRCQDPEAVAEILQEMLKMIRGSQQISEQEIRYLVRTQRKQQAVDLGDLKSKVLARTHSGKAISPKTEGQRSFIEAMEKKTIVFAVGPAGTGKTYLAVAYAVSMLKKGEIHRIILTRPAVEAGESLGFLPGDLKEKVDPYLRPLYDALHDLMGAETTEKLIEKGTIEIAPLAYMRGRTLDDAVIILDEAQNTTPAQMKMFLTRLGFQSRMIITGDVTQVDLPKSQRSGLMDAVGLLKGIEEIGVLQLSSDDVVRHPLVQKIIDRYGEKGE
ncbi:PhoH family protein [Holdemania filiformis]|uniref:PhoH family protein n=1 Tax=Holdemania filiformis TaxID=61171 RepID=UPI00266EE2E7|nr:PhoH family protein [Holdemania filiformis]